MAILYFCSPLIRRGQEIGVDFRVCSLDVDEVRVRLHPSLSGGGVIGPFRFLGGNGDNDGDDFYKDGFSVTFVSLMEVSMEDLPSISSAGWGPMRIVLLEALSLGR